MQILVIAAPGELAELVVCRATKHHGVTIVKFLRQACKFGYFSRADKRKVFRIEEDDFPLAWEARLGERFESALPFLFWKLESGLYPNDMERRQLASNSDHIVRILWLTDAISYGAAFNLTKPPHAKPRL